MNTLPTDTNEAGSMQQQRWFIVLLFVLAVVAIDSLTFRYLEQTWMQWLPSETEETETTRLLEGTLILAAVLPHEELENERYVVPLTYQFADDVFAYMPADILDGTVTDTIAYQHSFSHSGAYAVFAGAQGYQSTDATSSPSVTAIPYEIYQTEVPQTDALDEVVQALQSAESITNDATLTKQYPRVSDTGAVVYMAHAPGSPENLYISALAENWTVHLITTDGESQVITNGAYPTWIDDTTFVFLKNDGIYQYDSATATETKLWDSNGLVITAHGFLDVSPQTSLIAWTDAPGITTHLFTLQTEAEGRALVERGSIENIVRSAVFSPDGTRLAVQAMGVDSQTQGLDVTAIRFYDTTTLEEVEVPVATNLFDPELTYLVDWK